MLGSLLLLISVFYGCDLNGMLNNRGLVFCGNSFRKKRLVENLMITAYDPKLKETPFYEDLFMEDLTAPDKFFRADLETVDGIKYCSDYWQ